MLDYHKLGIVPDKHHIALRREGGDCPVYYEHCLTRGGFDGGYSIAYRKNNPGAELSDEPADFQDTFEPIDDGRIIRRHIRTKDIESFGGLWRAQRILLGNDDIRIGTAMPSDADAGLFQNGDGDLLLFIHDGTGRVESEVGCLEFRKRDYVWIPRGLIHQVIFDEPDPTVLVMECRGGLQIPSNFRNPTGQLKMDAPYCHRDFRRPTHLSEGEGPSRVLHKRHDKYTVRKLPHHPFDVVGWDGTVYPVAFNIEDYQPKTGLVHLPPPIHTTFLGAGGSFVVCSFVPRKVDYHPDAIPCPYPHSSYDCDEILWYVDGEFTSRKGVSQTSISFHPAGIPHAPQPGRYEASMGTERTDELAVMVDTYKPLQMTRWAAAAEDEHYHGSWAQ